MCSVSGFLLSYACDESVFFLQTFCYLRGGKKTALRGIACFVVMYLLNSKFPPRFISVDTKTLEVLPTQAHKAGLFF